MTIRRPVALVLLVLALLAASCSSSSDTGTVEAVSIDFAPVSISGDSLPPLGAGTNDTGLIAPDFTAQTTHSASETTVDVADGTTRLIGFFAHWCPHCQREVPRVVDYMANNDLPDGVEILAVSTGINEGAPNFPPSDWFDDEGWPTDVIVDSETSEISAAYGLTGFPYWVVTAGDGTVIQRLSGELTESQLDSLVQFAAANG